VHECPECFSACYCGGDVDDLILTDTVCTHTCAPLPDYEPRPLTSKERAEVAAQLKCGTLLDGAKPLKEK